LGRASRSADPNAVNYTVGGMYDVPNVKAYDKVGTVPMKLQYLNIFVEVGGVPWLKFHVPTKVSNRLAD
jgi:hypothetical protein